MRRAARVDDNQRQIVKELRRCGYSVIVMSHVGDGFADLVVGKNGKNWLVEVKDKTKPESQTRLTEKQQEFKDTWRGQYMVASDSDEIINTCK